MATDTTLQKRTMLRLFKQKAKPTNFLSSVFKTTERDIFKSRKCVIDIKRNDEQYAIDVVPFTGGRLNNNKRFTTKEYVPPMYNEYDAYFEEELLDRMPGMNEYSDIEYSAQFLAIATDDMVIKQEKILRSIEIQAAEVLQFGTITFQNNVSLDFKQKATHNFNASAAGTVWSNAAATPWVEIDQACTLNRKDGKVDMQNGIAIFGETAWNNFSNRLIGTGGTSRLDLRRGDFGSIVMPVPNISGAVYMGEITAGSYKVQCWTYPQFYTVPEGFGLANEGTLQPYIAADKCIVMPMSERIDLRLVYGGQPTLVPTVEPAFQGIGVTSIPRTERGDFQPYAYTDDKKRCVNIGVRSSPLCIPTQIDGWTVINTES